MPSQLDPHIAAALSPKRLEMAHALMPAETVLGLLVNPRDPGRSQRLVEEVQAAADHLGVKLKILRAGTEAEIEAAFADFAKLKAGPLVIGADAFYNAESRLLAELSLHYAVPAIYELMSSPMPAD